MTVEYNSKYKTILFIVFILLLGSGSFFFWRMNFFTPKPIFCTQEAKLCRDGSYVGRRGPDCEFAPCLDITDSNSSSTKTWQFPKLTTNYISGADWPPQITIQKDQHKLECLETSPESSLPQIVSKKIINGRHFCMEAMTEGAAGSVFSKYKYSTSNFENIVDFNFTLRYVNCSNYDEPQASECAKERENFSPDDLILELFSSLTIIKNFEDCLAAGFDITGNNPPKCTTIDGRVFPKFINSTWEELKAAIENYQIKKIFQTHSLVVSAYTKEDYILTAIEPNIDYVFDVIENAKGKCGDVMMITE